MKIRIFSLAKELNMDSKVLIEYCQRLGIVLKNSALASISPEEKDRVLAYIEQGSSPADTGTKAEPLTPVRETHRDAGGRVPVIAPPQPRAQTRRDQDDESPVAAEELPPEVEPEVAEEPAPIAEVEQPEPEVAAPVAAAAPEVEAPQPPPEVETPEVRSAPPESTAPLAPAKPDDAVVPPATPERGPLSPIRREDYMPSSGTGMRTMVARGTISDPGARGGAAKRPKGRPGPRLPTLAAPPPPPKSATVASAEGPAQKPDMRLSPDVIQKKQPLQDHIRQHAEEKKKKKHPDVETVEETDKKSVVKGGKAAVGAGLQTVRKDRQERRHRGATTTAEEDYSRKRPRGRSHSMRGRSRGPALPLKTSAEIESPISIRSLSAAIGRPANLLVRSLMQRGTLATINSSLDDETALELAMELGIDLQIKRQRDIEEELEQLAGPHTEGEDLISRPPIITILGHVDHGKTTLLDKIRSANVAGGEVGGITQHIAAYQVEHQGHKITFLDTPGHAAFGEMRARGANVTDIAVLVVAANDGVMPQTIEAISHARAAGVPMVVAMNKIDLPEKNENRVLQELAAQNILAAEWGGDTEVVRTSGTTGEGIEQLLETLLTVAELGELQTSASTRSHGVCLEAFLDEGRGVIAWLIVQEGTLRKGDVVLCGGAYGRIRTMYDDLDREIEEAGPSTPIKVSGLDIVPGAGDRYFVMDDLEEARSVAMTRRDRGREQVLSQRGRPQTLEDIVNAAQAGEVRDLPVIIKADTPGSGEALKGELLKFQHPEVRVNILHEGVGGVNESDVYLASASGAIIVAFHVVPEDRAQALADREGVEIRRYGIIYEVADDIKNALEGLLKPERVEVTTGRAVVLQTFAISRFGMIAGCRVLNGNIERTNRIHVIRDQRILNDYNIASLKRNKDDVREVRDGLECGIRLEGFNDLKEGDIFQAYKVEEVKRKL